MRSGLQPRLVGLVGLNFRDKLDLSNQKVTNESGLEQCDCASETRPRYTKKVINRSEGVPCLTEHSTSSRRAKELCFSGQRHQEQYIDHTSTPR